MYLQKNKLNNIHNIRSSAIYLPEDKNADSHRIHRFEFNVSDQKDYNKGVCDIITRNLEHVFNDPTNEYIFVQFKIETSSDINCHDEKFKKEINNMFLTNQIYNFFFKNPESVLSSINYVYNNLRKKLTIDIQLEGKAKFDIKNEFNLNYLCSFEPKLKNLNNQETMNYLIKKIKHIQNKCDITDDTHPVLNELAGTFDVNSQDFFNALKLHYEY